MDKVVKITSLKEKQTDFAYWITKSPQERLNAIETLRDQYIRFIKDVSRDFKEFVELLIKNKAEYLIVGCS